MLKAGLSEEEQKIDRAGEEVFALWASRDLTAASMIGNISEQIGAPLQADDDLAASRANAWAGRLAAVDPNKLSLQSELTRRFLRFEVRKLVESAELHRFDFQVTPYRVGNTLAEVHRYTELFTFERTSDLDRYSALLRQYKTFLVGTLQNLRDQAAMGIVVPASALPGCQGVIKGLAESLAQYVRVSPERLARISPELQSEFGVRNEGALAELCSAFADLQDYINGEYATRAPQQVGLSHYPGGHDAYEMLIRQHTTLDASAEQIHQRGIQLVAEIESDMARVRAELGFKGTGREFLEQVKSDRRFYCSTPGEVGELYMRLVRKCEAVMPKVFGSRSFPPFGVKRLAPESEAGMTFGYYHPPVAGGEQVGYYVYNGSNLDQRPTIGAASLIYHELIPGHHLHLSTEMGDAVRPLVRRMPTITAFNEGWAEYAADLGFELGLYEDPYDKYGRYLLQVFLASRLVVDTGLNALGWSLERARAYMLDHTAQSATEIASETLRYSTSIPGQSLAYAPGRQHLWQVRRDAERRMGSRFDLPAFHGAILDGGSLPLADVSFSIEQWSTQQ